MKAYVCDICSLPITEPYSAKMREFCFTISNCDIYQEPEQTKRKEKIHLCNNCFEGFKAIAKAKAKKLVNYESSKYDVERKEDEGK